jgi:cell division protease FtsH
LEGGDKDRMSFDEEIEEGLDDLDIDDDDDELYLGVDGLEKRSADIVAKFLGQGKKADVPIIAPRYYSDILAWALQRYIKAEGWKIVDVLCHSRPTPRYTDVNTDYGRYENVLCDGRLLLQKGDNRFAATIKATSAATASLVITSFSGMKKRAQRFAEGVYHIAKEHNFYKGKKLEFSHRISFLELSSKNWQHLALDPSLKDEIMANTVDFLNRRTQLAMYGIPARRGVLLVGEPGTGKTLICKILMNNSPGITCILANGSDLVHSEYIFELYELAQDLKPSMVFIEDIDLIGQRRMESHYSTGRALSTLLSALDGVEECKEVVTIATTNWLEILDETLRKRPSRFDRIIKMSLPSLEQRREMIKSLSQAIPMDEYIQDYLAHRTDSCTPAQVQEVAYSLVIEHKLSAPCDELGCCKFSIEEVDNALSKMNGNSRRMGFKIPGDYRNHGAMVGRVSETGETQVSNQGRANALIKRGKE